MWIEGRERKDKLFLREGGREEQKTCVFLEGGKEGREENNRFGTGEMEESQVLY